MVSHTNATVDSPIPPLLLDHFCFGKKKVFWQSYVLILTIIRDTDLPTLQTQIFSFLK